MLHQLNPFIGEPSTHFTWFSKAELTAWGKDLGDSTTQLNLDTPAQRETEARRWMKNAETGTPISYSRAKEMVTYCWNDDVSHPGIGFGHFTHTQVHISDDCWTDNKQLKIVAQGAKVRRRFQADSGYMPPDIPQPSVLPSTGLSMPFDDLSSHATSRPSTRQPTLPELSV